MHSAGLELAKLTYTRLEDNLIHRRGDRLKCLCKPDPQSMAPPSPSDIMCHQVDPLLTAPYENMKT